MVCFFNLILLLLFIIIIIMLTLWILKEVWVGSCKKCEPKFWGENGSHKKSLQN